MMEIIRQEQVASEFIGSGTRIYNHRNGILISLGFIVPRILVRGNAMTKTMTQSDSGHLNLLQANLLQAGQRIIVLSPTRGG